MNLQTSFLQPNPFRLTTSSYEDVFPRKRSRYTPIPSQQRIFLMAQSVEPKQKENLSLSSDAIKILGENGKRRFNEFKLYPDCWFGGGGNKISKYSVEVFERFIKKLPELKKFHPSIFLTLDGNISLGFEDKNHKSIEIEFYSGKVEYFIESLDEDTSVGLADTFALAKKIKKLLQ